ncbi:hypothetical protein BDZ89DRAFT_534092 [Hymenopellis radicata]|nr:hypothetical protein BDZ89DRAFT_534092 [Hymenopellis radicata]
MSLDSDDDADVAHRAMIVAWVGAACMTCLVYDHLITLDQECSRIWPARFTIGRILFFINRYVVEGMLLFTFMASTFRDPSTSLCVLPSLVRHKLGGPDNNRAGDSRSPRLGIISYEQTRHMERACSLPGSFTMIVITILDYVVETVTVEEVIHLPGCYAKSVPSIIAAYWITPAIVESVLFFLVMARGFVWWKHGDTAPAILTFMARDSTMYFAIMFALLIANCCMFYFGPAFLSSLLVNPLSTASCILGSRLLLNLGAAVEPATPSEWAIVSSETRWTRPQDAGDLPDHYVMPFDDEEFVSDLLRDGDASNDPLTPIQSGSIRTE